MSNRKKIRKLERTGQTQDGAHFTNNPASMGYTRPATPDERAALDLAPGTRVHITRVGNQRIRAFMPPLEGDRRN